jgi:hypothetical protein
MKEREYQRGDSILATECVAFLNGTLAEYWDEKGLVVPVWAWMNLLAHGSEALIGDSVWHPYRPRRASRSWRIARTYLAYQVMDVTEADFTLEDLQASLLVPLELELAARDDVSRWTPRQWADTVDRVIHQHSPLEQ